MKTAEMEEVETRRFRRTEKRFRDEPESLGLFGSVQNFLGTALAAVESRIELITVELKELKGRAMSVVAWAFALVFLGFMTVISIMGVVVFALWDNAAAVLAGFSAFFIILAIASFFAAKNQLKKIPFGETVDQLRKDRELVSKEIS